MDLASARLPAQAAPDAWTSDLEAQIHTIDRQLVNNYSAVRICGKCQRMWRPSTYVNAPLYLCRSSGGVQSQPISLLVQLHALLLRRSCAVWDHAGGAARGAFV